MRTTAFELLTTKLWNVLPEYLHSVRSTIQNNLSMRIGLDEIHTEKIEGFFCSERDGFANKTLVSYSPEDDYRIEEGEEFIDVICVNGPITRNGDACSYGSKNHRDQLIYAAGKKNCIGHIVMIDSPGGSAASKYDYMAGIQAAHDAGQKVIGLVDGMCCSAAQALACLCDEVYYGGEHDTFGCIGTMAAFYTMADGGKNQFTDETYHEIYDPESFEKNIEFRELANEGKDEKIIEELRKDGEEFRMMVKEKRPGVTEEHLHGATFTAKEVEGVLNDGMGNFDFCVQRLLDMKVNNTDGTTNNITENKNMKQYENINEALNVEALAVTEDGSFYCNAPLAETLERKLEEAKREHELLAANIETVTKLDEEIKKIREEKNAVTAEKDSANADYAALMTKYEELNKQTSDLLENIKTLEESVSLLEKTVKEQEKTIAEKNAEVEELSKIGTPQPKAKEMTEDNTASAKPEPHNVYKEGMSPKEMREAHLKRMATLARINR